jgi:hypothetical protein
VTGVCVRLGVLKTPTRAFARCQTLRAVCVRTAPSVGSEATRVRCVFSRLATPPTSSGAVARSHLKRCPTGNSPSREGDGGLKLLLGARPKLTITPRVLARESGRSWHPHVAPLVVYACGLFVHSPLLTCRVQTPITAPTVSVWVCGVPGESK